MQTDNHPFHNLAGEQKGQFLITCDKDGNPIEQATREECHKGNGKTHLAFMAFVYDGKGNMWMTRRSKKKSLWGGYWDASIVSHVLLGESVEEATRRRGKEELGCDVEFKRVGSFYYFAKFDGDCENEFCHVLVGKTSETPHPNPVEIEEVKKMKAPQLYDEVTRHEKIYTPWLIIAVKKLEIPNSI